MGIVNPAVLGSLFAGSLTLGIVLMLELGRRIRRVQQVRHGDEMAKGLGAVEGAVFGVMGLLLAFTFSGAAIPSTSCAKAREQPGDDKGSALHVLHSLPASILCWKRPRNEPI